MFLGQGEGGCAVAGRHGDEALALQVQPAQQGDVGVVVHHQHRRRVRSADRHRACGESHPYGQYRWATGLVQGEPLPGAVATLALRKATFRASWAGAWLAAMRFWMSSLDAS